MRGADGVREGGDDGLVEDGGYGKGAFRVVFPEGLKA